MTTYNDVFGGANIYPSEVSWSLLQLTNSVTLNWPEETSTSENLATRIIDVIITTPGSNITLPDANKASTGETILFNNIGSNQVIVYDASGVQVVTVLPGQLWQIYLADNSTVAGVWRSLRYGASTTEANASALAGNGLVAISTLLSQSVPVTSFSSNYTAGASDRATFLNWRGSSGTLQLPTPDSVGPNWFIYVRNSGSGLLTVDPLGGVDIDGALTKAFQPTESSIIVCDGVGFYSLGYGQSAQFSFDYTVIDVSGTGNYTLSGSEINRIAYRFTGTLTGNRTVIVPATVQQYWVDNQTSGAFTLTIKTSGNPGQSIAQGQRAIYYCNGVDVVDADTANISLPLQVSDGGTGATTASAARINLGATSLGSALFTAASTASAYSSLGVAPSGIVNGGSF